MKWPLSATSGPHFHAARGNKTIATEMKPWGTIMAVFANSCHLMSRINVQGRSSFPIEKENAESLTVLRQEVQQKTSSKILSRTLSFLMGFANLYTECLYTSFNSGCSRENPPSDNGGRTIVSDSAAWGVFHRLMGFRSTDFTLAKRSGPKFRSCQKSSVVC